jgi:hypothetical protein
MTSKFVLPAALWALAALPALAGSITTTFAGGNRFDGNMFNATIGPSAITVNGLDVNVDARAATIDVYLKTGTYLGFETNPAAWTLVSATSITGLGSGSETPVSVTPFSLAAGMMYGVYVTIDTNANAAPYMYYTNGNNTYRNSDLSLSLGEGIGGKFGSLAVDPSRTWNGTIDYALTTSSVPEPVTCALLGIAVPGLWLARRRHLRKY